MRNPSSFTYYLGLGTNLGDKEANLRTAVRLLEERVGKVTSLSAFHATEPWGFASDHTFLNAAAGLHTSQTPLEVLERTQEIERLMGRNHKSVNGVYADRVIDIDLLLCFAEDGRPVRINTEKLTLPHPLMRQREFVMKPLQEIIGPAPSSTSDTSVVRR
ncbi:MAG TPA: 2-amino-4-hydroxy-6-hydroxymethyldihydropteridine diphosphokinase [Candidatus Bacteroides pullicola]|uniref:2-amino-4-hydroxy-6-hydroxymethyldihydropteridine pyrophosphokinase n=1 Tax=Candidatus Bacteroides pullicola TaxID=2838475 RepID=A0A9D1ZK04_9BACE|nr:2-amino-4-hydroxy-6-hydroxymethyldihydropteridine diphosphokinase [Candidatus Bacteroides pullicola]